MLVKLSGLLRCAPVLALSLSFAACKKSTPEAKPEATATGTAAAAPATPPPGSQADTLPLNADLGQVAIPEDNPQSEEKIALGHQLFFDKRLSADGSRSCYSCHQNEDGNGGKEPMAIGAKNKQLTRHSPVIWNVAFLSRFYWDGRSESLEAQAKAAWAGGNMGVGNDKLEAKAKEIAKIAGYKTQFEKVFPGKGVTPETIVQAISAYERTLICDDTAFDRFAKGQKNALDQTQKHGLELFMTKAGCVACHTPPQFTIAALTKEGAFFNTGVGVAGKKEEDVDIGRMAVTKKETDWAAFKPPSLRNVSKSAPYFHDGSAKTLEEAVRFMASGGFKNKNLSAILSDKKLSDEEIKALVAFLGALDCNKKLEEPKLP